MYVQSETPKKKNKTMKHNGYLEMSFFLFINKEGRNEPSNRRRKSGILPLKGVAGISEH
jgi:hypothetical protein